MTLANEGFDGLGTPNGLKVLVGLVVRGKRAVRVGPPARKSTRPTDDGSRVHVPPRANPHSVHASPLFTAGIWLADAWVVVFVCFLLAFPHGRLKPGFDLFVIGLFALMAFPLELSWLLFFETGGSPENALSSGRTPASRTTSTLHSGLWSRWPPSSWLSL